MSISQTINLMKINFSLKWWKLMISNGRKTIGGLTNKTRC